MLLAIPVSPGVVLGILTWVYRDGELAGTIVFIGALMIWLSVATIKVTLSQGILSKSVFGVVWWSVEIDKVHIHESLSGDLPLIPAIIVSDQETGRQIGYILKPQFPAKDIQALRSALNLSNAR